LALYSGTEEVRTDPAPQKVRGIHPQSLLNPSITIPVIVVNLCLSFVSTVVTFMVPDLLDRVQKLVVKDNDDSLMFLKGAHETTPSGYAEVVLGGT
jgi:hypothetical protein